MKKKIFSLLALIMMGVNVMAGDKPVITVSDVEAMPGQTVSFAVNLTDGKADKYTAMTLYAQFPTTQDGFTIKSVSVASAWQGTTGSAGQIDETTKIATIPFASENPIPGSAVNNLVTVSFEVGSSVPNGVYKVILKGTMFEYNTSDKDYADDVTFEVTVTDRITLDEESTVAPSAAEGVNVKVKRTITAGNWSTICLPFDMTEAQVKAAFGDDVQLAEYVGHDVDNADITIFFEDADLAKDGLIAKYPYIIKTSKDIDEFTIDGVDVDPNEEEAVAEYEEGRGSKKKVVGRLKGTFHANTTIPENGLFISNNIFYSSTGKTKMKAFRAYFEILNLESSSAARAKMSITDGNGNTTNIDPRTMQTIENGKVYNMNGQYVGEAEDANSLPKGVYIVNGKKKVIK